jgi:hypothetical protein
VANRTFTRQFYTFHEYPVLVDCNFIVDSTNGNGLGIRSLKGEGVKAVYMHTSATPAAGNPNPPAGYIYLQFTDAYFRYFGGFSGQVSPVSGTPLTATTAHSVYTIVSLGTATLAQWQAVGFPAGVTPTVGASFIATASATIGGSAAVEVPATTGSGIDHIEAIGDANQTIHTSGYTNGVRNPPYLILACFNQNAITAPANGTAISLASYLSNSSNEVDGE